MTEIPDKLLDDSNKNDSTTLKDAFFFLRLNECKKYLLVSKTQSVDKFNNIKTALKLFLLFVCKYC